MWVITTVLLMIGCAILAISSYQYRKRLERNEVILQLSLELSSTVERRKLLHLIMERSALALGAERASIILMDHETGELYFEVATGLETEQVKQIRLPAGEGIAGWVQINGKSVLIPNVSKDPRWSNKVQNKTEFVTRNMICVPVSSNGTLLGVLQVINKLNNGKFTATDLKLLESLSSPIAMSLENMMLYEALKHSMDTLQQTTAAKEKILSEMRVASQIQESLLPGESFTHGRLKLNAALQPAREVGGDFYHFFEVDEEHILICLGDVSDKGMPAALFMSSLMIWIRAKAEKNLGVSDIVEAINNEISTDSSTMFATLFIAIVNTTTGVMQYCDAGHCPALILQNGQVSQLESHKGLPIGVMPGASYISSELKLSEGASVILYSDGITEAENDQGEMYGLQRLENHLKDYLDESFQATAMIKEVQRFAKEYPQSDDIAVLCFTMI